MMSVRAEAERQRQQGQHCLSKVNLAAPSVGLRKLSSFRPATIGAAVDRSHYQRRLVREALLQWSCLSESFTASYITAGKRNFFWSKTSHSLLTKKIGTYFLDNLRVTLTNSIFFVRQ